MILNEARLACRLYFKYVTREMALQNGRRDRPLSVPADPMPMPLGKEKRPPEEEIGRRFRRGKLCLRQAGAINSSTNRENYGALISYQPLILQRSYVEMHAFSPHLASRLVPCLTTIPRFVSRRNTVSARTAMISLNATSPEGIPFACMTATAISADVSGPVAVRKASCVSWDSSLRAKYRVRRYARLGGMASGFVPGENNVIVASKFARFARWRAIRFSRS
jgi:hypothetical protein